MKTDISNREMFQEVPLNDISVKTKTGTEKSKWTHKLDYTLTMIGYCVGFGNIWRFPYLCMRNGGGAFLIPYFIFLFVCGLPLFYLESVIGQFSGCSVLAVWKMSPLFKGLGIGTIVVSGLCTAYYNAIMTWTLYFLGMSFTSHLPWQDCNNDWNTPQCFTPVSVNNNNATNTSQSLYQHLPMESNDTMKQRTPQEEFWQYNVLELSSGIDEIGGIRWQLALCMLAAWLIVFACICKGVKSTGKVVYVTATVPYIFLTALLIRGATLPGSINGIIYFLKPDVSKLRLLKTWAEACIQIFYTLGPGWGGIVTMASFNRFNNNCKRDAFVISLTCCGTSFYGGFVVFSVIGFLAHELGEPIEEVVTSGPGLAFIVYPAALAKLPISPLWSVCFFLMLLTIGLDSQFVQTESVICGCMDYFPKFHAKNRTSIAAIVCFVCFLISLIFVTRAGMYAFQLVDWYIAAFSVMTIGFLECLVVTWVYGFERLNADIEMMLNHRPSVIWKALWGVITPGLLIAMLLYNAVTLTAPSYGSYTYPGWAIGLGFLISILGILPIPLYMIYGVANTRGSLRERLRHLIRPSDSWGPSTEPYRSQYWTDLRSSSTD